MAVRPDGNRRIKRPSDVMPVTRLRTIRVRPCCEYPEALRLAGRRLDFETTDLSLLEDVDERAVVGVVDSLFG